MRRTYLASSPTRSAIYLFATYPEQWHLLKNDPSLIANAVNEVVRFASPLRAFTRKVLHHSDIGGVRVPAGACVLVMYASANRDQLE